MFFHQLTGIPGKMYEIFKITLQGTNISPKNGIFEEDFPFPQVGYVSFLEGKITTTMGWFLVETPLFILEGLEPSTVTYGAACSACGRCKRWQQARQQNINPPLQVEWFSKFCWSDVAWICPSKIECICFGLVLDDWHVNDPQFKGNKVKSTQVYTSSTMQCPRLIVEGSHVQHVAPWECLGSDDLRVGEWYLWSPPLWLTFIGADFFWPSKIFDPPKVPQFLATAKSESYLFNLRSMGGF